MSHPYDQVWIADGSAGEAGDLAATLAEVRQVLAGGPLVQVTLRVGTRAFGEKVLAQLEDSELGRVSVVLSLSGDGDGVD